MRIRPIKTVDDDFAAWFDVQSTARAADDPDGPRWPMSELRVVYKGTEHHDAMLWLAEDGGRTVGAALLGLPMRDNLTLAELDVFVRPECRRRGFGTALLDVLETSAGELGRTSAVAYTSGPARSPSTPGTAFAEHHGFTHRITEISRVQRPPYPLEAIAEAERSAQPAASDYEIVTWRDRVPDEYILEYARLESRLSTDAPLGDLEYEGEVWDEARIRESERRRALMGRSSWSAVAVAPDGTLAGVTVISLANDSDEVAFQETTIVDPAHRGHRLGLLLKAANFRALLAERPGVQAVWTWNADVNAQMIAINETMGYRVHGWEAAYQRDLKASAPHTTTAPASSQTEPGR